MAETTTGNMSITIASISAIISAIALLFNARTYFVQAKVADTTSYLAMFDKISSYEEKMVERLSSSSNGISRVLVDHLNFIEHMANLHNKALLMKHTLLMCRQTLINHVALIISDSTLRSSFEKSVTDVETFEQIGIFYRTHKKPIEDRSAQYEKYRLISQGTHD